LGTGDWKIGKSGKLKRKINEGKGIFRNLASIPISFISIIVISIDHYYYCCC